jgi:hypothetical protein
MQDATFVTIREANYGENQGRKAKKCEQPGPGSACYLASASCGCFQGLALSFEVRCNGTFFPHAQSNFQILASLITLLHSIQSTSLQNNWTKLQLKNKVNPQLGI